jgi:hypothetical protein
MTDENSGKANWAWWKTEGHADIKCPNLISARTHSKKTKELSEVYICRRRKKKKYKDDQLLQFFDFATFSYFQ